MSRITQAPQVGVDVSIKLTEAEIRALEALAGYGTEPFLKVFYAQMGKAYLQPYEDGLRSLFDTIRSELPPIIKRADAARTAFALQDPVIRSRREHEELVQRLAVPPTAASGEEG